MVTVSEVMAEKAVLELRVSALAKVSGDKRKVLTANEKRALGVILSEESAKLESYMGTQLTVAEVV